MTQNEHVYDIHCRPEGAGDVICSENVKTTESEGYTMPCKILRLEKKNEPFALCIDDGRHT